VRSCKLHAHADFVLQISQLASLHTTKGCDAGEAGCRQGRVSIACVGAASQAHLTVTTKRHQSTSTLTCIFQDGNSDNSDLNQGTSSNLTRGHAPTSSTMTIPTTTTPIRQNDSADIETTIIERGAHVLSLPPELWNLIFLQHTDPQHLWITGRQVCSTWRAEIPKVIAKKYLEDRNMTAIKFGPHCIGGGTCLDRDFCFSHYKGKGRTGFVPREARNEKQHREECNERYALLREGPYRNIKEFCEDSPCRECIDKTGARRCDMPGYHIRIKREFLDTELAGLEIYFNGRWEISVEWEAMLDAFYHEAAVLSRRDDEFATKSIQWLSEEKRSNASVYRRAVVALDALWIYRSEVRRERIKKWHHHDYNAEDSDRFDREDWDYFEEEVLGGLRFLHHLAEDNAEEQMWESQASFDRNFGPLMLWSWKKKETMGPAYVGHLDYRKDEQHVSPVWACEFLWDKTPEEIEDFEARCMVQWLGRGRIHFDSATIV
jgi:hypothetical protein